MVKNSSVISRITWSNIVPILTNYGIQIFLMYFGEAMISFVANSPNVSSVSSPGDTKSENLTHFWSHSGMEEDL